MFNNKTTLSILITRNSNTDIIQIKKPFFGNVLQVKIDRKSLAMIHLQESNFMKKESGINLRPFINWFYRCFELVDGNFKILNSQGIEAKCLKKNTVMDFNIQSNYALITGFITI
jgi:hypothetical protein|tara:strand:- start:865 stop:1209 length:345 start_codon:yes stop_codon:yes gene_type:complete